MRIMIVAAATLNTYVHPYERYVGVNPIEGGSLVLALCETITLPTYEHEPRPDPLSWNEWILACLSDGSVRWLPASYIQMGPHAIPTHSHSYLREHAT